MCGKYYWMLLVLVSQGTHLCIVANQPILCVASDSLFFGGVWRINRSAFNAKLISAHSRKMHKVFHFLELPVGCFGGYVSAFPRWPFTNLCVFLFTFGWKKKLHNSLPVMPKSCSLLLWRMLLLFRGKTFVTEIFVKHLEQLITRN